MQDILWIERAHGAYVWRPTTLEHCLMPLRKFCLLIIRHEYKLTANSEIFKPKIRGSIAQEGYSKLVDMYSLGAIVVTVLSGTQLQRVTGRAFDDIPAMRELDLARIYDDPNCPYISPEVKTFIKGLLCYQQERFDVKQARESSWLSRHASLLDSIYKRAIAGWNSRSAEMAINRWIENQQHSDIGSMQPPKRNITEQEADLSKRTASMEVTPMKDTTARSSCHDVSYTDFPTPTHRASHYSIQDVILEPKDFIIHEDTTAESVANTSVPSNVLTELKSPVHLEGFTSTSRVESNASTASPIVNHIQRREKRQRRYETVSYDDEIEQENDEELAKSTCDWVTAKVAEDKRRRIISSLHDKKAICVSLEQKDKIMSPLR